MSRDAWEAVEREVRSRPGQTTHEMAKVLQYGDSTVRKHLYRLLWRGQVERRVDSSVRSPRGFGVDRWYWREAGLGEPTSTNQLLCTRCVEDLYADRLRYQWARTDAVKEREWQESEERIESVGHVVACDRCGSEVFEGQGSEGEA